MVHALGSSGWLPSSPLGLDSSPLAAPLLFPTLYLEVWGEVDMLISSVSGLTLVAFCFSVNVIYIQVPLTPSVLLCVGQEAGKPLEIHITHQMA